MKKETSKNAAEEGILTDMPYDDPSEEEMQQEFQEILKKRKEYQKEIEEEVRGIQKEEVLQKHCRFSSVAKVAVVVLVAGTCLFAFCMRSEANRMWWLSRVEKIIGSDRGHVVNNDEERVVSETEEEQAIAEIMEKAGVPMPQLGYKPDGFVFDGYDYDEAAGRGGMYYLYDDYMITITGHIAGEDAAYAWNYDGEILKEEMLEMGYGSVVIQEIGADGDAESSSVAEWIYHNHQYRIMGKLPFEELKIIVENIFY